MIKYMIDQNADLNYVSPLGYINYPYFLLSKSNFKIIKYEDNANNKTIAFKVGRL